MDNDDELTDFPIDDHLFWGSTIVNIGKRRGGKTFAMKQQIRRLNPDLTIVFTGSIGSYDDFASMTSPMHVVLGFDQELYESTIRLISSTGFDRPERICFVFDDLGPYEEILRDQFMDILFANGRNLGVAKDDPTKKIGVTVILSIQSPMMITPTVRGNTDYLFLFKMPSAASLTTVNKEYFCLGPASKLQNLLADLKKVHKHGCLVRDDFDNMSEKSLYWMVAKPDPGGLHGPQEVLDFCDLLFDPVKHRPQVVMVKPMEGKSKKRCGKTRTPTRFVSRDQND